ncbi:HTH domain-containing protein, partial [Methylobacterium trifolii]|uniref:HTH domain-containing protein n=1 Tax=Methylobacterium trifolii TaxID=1003092 RepID=UPI0040396397
MAKKASESKSLLAKGGGNATAGGVTMQASIAASIAVRLLAAVALDKRLGLGAAKPTAICFETEVPVDDLVIETEVGGWVFIQSKNSLTGRFVLTSELGKTCDEFARLWLLTKDGNGQRGWDRPLVGGKDAMLLAVGHETSGPIKVGLPKALNAVRMQSTATLAEAEQKLLVSFKALMRSAFDAHGAPADLDLDAVLRFIHVIDYDFGGPQRELAENRLKALLELPDQAPGAFKAIERECQNAMKERGRLDGGSFRASLAADGLLLKAAAKGLLETHTDIRADTQAILWGQREIAQALSGAPTENRVITDVAGRRLSELRQVRFAAGFDSTAACNLLLTAVETGELAAASSAVSQSIFAWCARILASIDHEKARYALFKAQAFGSSAETTIADAFVEAFAQSGDRAKALATLEPLNTRESLAATLIIAVHNLSPEEGLRWLERTGLSLDRLHPDGKFRALGIYLATSDFNSALKIVDALGDTDFEATPALLLLSGQAHLEQTVHPHLRDALQAPLPPNLADFPLAEDTEAMAHRTKAISYYNRAATAFELLGARQAASIAADRALWLKLRDPSLAVKALEELQGSMADEKVRLRRVPLAFAFSLILNLQAVEEDIERATALTGEKSLHAAVARFEVALRRKAPDVAGYIDRHREQLLEYYHPDFLTSIEIESLAKAGRAEDARVKLAILESKDIPPNALVTLRSLIEGAAGADVAAFRETAYRANPTIPALLNLVAELEHSRDFTKLAEFAGILFGEVKDVTSAETYISALQEIQADEKIAAMGEAYPEIVEASTRVSTSLAWAYYRLGRLGDSKSCLEKLRVGRDVQTDRHLAMNIAIASGDWSSLNTFVETEWQNREKRDATELLRAGVLAQRIGATPRSQELVREAARKADGDAKILSASYSTAASAGWENEEKIHGWLQGAISASGEDGPVQRMDIRELLSLQPDWDDQMNRTWDLVVRGEAPLFAAAKVARRTLLDVFLRPALRNLGQADPRRRSPIFAFNGTKPIRSDVGKRVAIDLTSLLTLSLTGKLRQFLAWADSVTIAQTTLSWLFEERDKLAFHQPSQVRRAREVKQLIDADRVHRFEGAVPPQELELRVGSDIAQYLVAAETLDEQDKSPKIVVRPAPLPKPGSLLEQTADISGYETFFAGVGDVLAALKRGGHLSDVESANANAYLRLHEQAWPHSPVVQSGATLYLDDVALSFFQHLGMLSRLPMAGFKVFVTSSEVERANELVSYDASADDARTLVESLQVALRDEIASGKVKLGRLLLSGDDEDNFDLHPSRQLLAGRPEIDALIVDDRFVNSFGTHEGYPLVTSIDLFATMAESGDITLSELTEAISVIRQAGLLFVPLRSGELEALLTAAPVTDFVVQETAELRAVRESIVRARMTDALQLPNEGLWLDTLTREATIALRSQWQESVPDETAQAKSRWLLELFDARGWAHRSAAVGLAVTERYRAQLLMLSILPMPDEETRARYWNWLGGAVLEGFKEEQPESYAELLTSIREIVEQQIGRTLGGEDDDEGPNLRGAVVLDLLKLFPDSIREDISHSESFRSKYYLTLDSVLTLNCLGISFQSSKLFLAIRKLFDGPDTSIIVKPIEGEPVELSIERGVKPKLFLMLGEVRRQMPSFFVLAEDRETRLGSFEDEVSAANLPPRVIEAWREKIEKGPLTEDEIGTLTQDFKLTPQSVAAAIRGELTAEAGQVSVIVPRKASYYCGLIGERGAASNVEAYAAGNAKAQI